MFFFLSSLWGGLLMAFISWVDNATVQPTPHRAIATQLIAILFALPMLMMVLFRLNDLRWPRSLVVPTCALYVAMSAGQLLNRPLLLGRIPTAVLGLYSGLLYLALTFPVVSTRGGNEETFGDRSERLG